MLVMATSLANSRRQHGKFLHMSQRGQSHFLVIIVESVERQSDIRSKLLEQSDGSSEVVLENNLNWLILCNLICNRDSLFLNSFDCWCLTKR